MAQVSVPSYQGYEDPIDLVDRTEIPYEERLKVLQAWQEELARSGASDEQRQHLVGAIQALEMGAEVQNDDPVGEPEGTGYAAGDK